MKKLLLLLAVAIGGALGVVGGFYLHNNGFSLPPGEEEIQKLAMDYADSIVYERLNPVFNNADDLVTYRSEMSEHMTIDSVFLGIPSKTLIDVATVCINKYGFVSKENVVKEYKANDVYTNLPTDPSAYSNVEGSGVTKVDSPATVIIGTDYQYRTDTIDGVPRKVLYKTEKSYEK